MKESYGAASALAPLVAVMAISSSHAFQLTPRPLSYAPHKVSIPAFPASRKPYVNLSPRDHHHHPSYHPSYRRLHPLYERLQEEDPLSKVIDVTATSDSEAPTLGDIDTTDTSEASSKLAPHNMHNMHSMHSMFQNLHTKLKQTLDNMNMKVHNVNVPALMMAIFVFFLPLFALSPSDAAWAVMSGGRMGGSMGGSRSSSSRSYSAPSSSGMGGYSRGFRQGYSSGYYSRPSVVVSPGINPFYSPFYSPFSYGPSYYARPPGVVVTGGGFGGIFTLVGFFVLASLVLSSMSSTMTRDIGSGLGDAVRGGLGGVGGGQSAQSALGSGVSVAEITVALQVPDRDSPNSILSALDRLSRTAKTDSRVGLQNLTSQVALELLRRKQSIVAASTRASNYRDETKAQREFNNMSIRERGKFQRETVSKYGGVDYSPSKPSSSSLSPYSAKATMAVVTIILHIDGDSTSKALSSNVNSIRDVEEALSRIAADSKVDDCLRGVEILWTPEEREETLSMKDVFADYSSLRSV